MAKNKETTEYQQLDAAGEIAFIKEISGNAASTAVFNSLRDSYNTLQARSQMLLGLVTICLTITGFSGPRIAASCIPARIAIFFGLSSVLITAICLVLGPLRLKWITSIKYGSTEETLEYLLKRRDRKTRLYHLAIIFLVAGIAGYVASMAFYLLSLPM